jgi:hypothetical protein
MRGAQPCAKLPTARQPIEGTHVADETSTDHSIVGTPAGPPRQRAYLLQSRVQPFPVAGDLELTAGSLKFTMDEMAGEAVLGWVEKELVTSGLKERLKGGERVGAFDLPLSSLAVDWPKQFMGSAMKVSVPGSRDWLVSLVYPSGSLYSTYKIWKHRAVFKAWREAMGG